MMDFKEKELSHKLFDTLKQQFHDLELVEIVESPVYRDSIWVRLIMPADEDREIEIRKMASELSTDILLEYGYDIGITSANRTEKIAA
jgi:hypothetical protein